MQKHFNATLEDWDNLSDDVSLRAPDATDDYRSEYWEGFTEVEKSAYTSFEACGQACEYDPSCYQYLYHDQTCGLSRSFRLGLAKPPDDAGERYMSGFNLERINAFTEKNSCLEPEWV